MSEEVAHSPSTQSAAARNSSRLATGSCCAPSEQAMSGSSQAFPSNRARGTHRRSPCSSHMFSSSSSVLLSSLMATSGTDHPEPPHQQDVGTGATSR
ncbi:Os04g0169666 [Oryza sativa Japonica Group]|uniref:Os04g0169666 protein n=1 Tax=Oryza sativa subsp. japonica TaxID=39947 RepID=A0A0P0W6Z2_ORYSJ|nr:hypothetical protein EE612_022203 [Oryza sativa]BAS87900.1 Os04g0169666 [Oryza sativa Japonica Group]